MADRADSERSMNLARRWFTEGWGRNVELADDLFSENVRTNGVLVGAAGPKRRIQERLAGFPDLTTTIEDMFSAHDKVVTRLVWRGTHTGPCGGVKATGQAGGGPRLCRLAFRRRQGGGNLNHTGLVRASKADRIFPQTGLCRVARARWPRAAGSGTRQVARTLRRERSRPLTSYVLSPCRLSG